MLLPITGVIFIFLRFFFLEIAVDFLVETSKTVFERRCYVSCINITSVLTFQSDTANLRTL